MTDNGERRGVANIDVGALLEGLRAEVRARRLAQGQGEASPLERDLQRSLDEIELHRVVSAHWPLIGATLLQRALALINKLVRRYLRWYINPIVEQQNAYNDAVAGALRLLADAYADLGGQIALSQRPTIDHRPPTAEEPRAENREPESAAHSPLSSGADNGQRTTDNGQVLRSQYLELMALVAERGAAEPPARFPDLELRALAPHLNLRQAVNAHWPLPGTTLPQRAIALINKLVRRYLRWYINPIVEQQNAANSAITTALLALIRLDAERRAQIASLRAAKLRDKR